MQINPFGFPLGAGFGPALPAGGAMPGFAETLGLALGTGAPSAKQPATCLATLPANAPGVTLTASVGAQPQQLVSIELPETPALPSVQVPTPLSQLMTTATRLPTTGQPVVAEIATPRPTAAETLARPVAVESVVAQPVEKAATLQPRALATAAAPVEVTPEQPAIAAPLRASRKPASVAKDEPTAPEPAGHVQDAQPQLAALLVQAPSPPRPEPMPRPAPRAEAEPIRGGGKKPAVVAPIADVSQPAPPTGDGFAQAIEAKDSSGSGGSSDTPQHDTAAPEIKIAAARHDAAPAMPLPVQAPAGVLSPSPPTSPAEPLLAVRAGHLGQALGVEVARRIEAGGETLRVRLSPEHLGRVEVTLAFDDGGRLQATVRAESPHALDLLRNDAADLARTLDQAGIRTDAQSLRFETRTDGGNGQPAPQQQQQQHDNRRSQQQRADDLEPAPAYRILRGDGQLDLLA